MLLPKRYNYAKVEMILGQDAYHAIRPLEFFKTYSKSPPVFVRLPLGWVLSGPMPSASGLTLTGFKAVVEHDFELATRINLWSDMQSYWAIKQVYPCSASNRQNPQSVDRQVVILWVCCGLPMKSNFPTINSLHSSC